MATSNNHPYDGTAKDPSEIRGVANETRLRDAEGLPSSYKYGTDTVNKKSLEIEKRKVASQTATALRNLKQNKSKK